MFHVTRMTASFMSHLMYFNVTRMSRLSTDTYESISPSRRDFPNTLQHTATRCNTLQHAATRCNTLQHAATYFYTLRHTATHCIPLQHTFQHTPPHSNTFQHTPTHTLKHNPTHSNTLQHPLQHQPQHTGDAIRSTRPSFQISRKARMRGQSRSRARKRSGHCQ